MDPQMKINSPVLTTVFVGKFFDFFNETFSKQDSSEEPEWLFVGSTCHTPSEVSSGD